MTQNALNLVLITVDQMRGDIWELEQSGWCQTPNLRMLAERGTVFRRAYSAAPSCVPARAAIFTGLSPSSHGRVGFRVNVPWQYHTTLPGELAKGGYHTQGVGKMHVFPTRSLLGFHNVTLHDGYTHYNRNWATTSVKDYYDFLDDYLEWYRQRAGPNCDLTDMGLDCNGHTVARMWTQPTEWHPTNWTVTESIRFLRKRDPGKPFFLWTSFVRPHPPYDPPASYMDLYDEEMISEPTVGDWAPEVKDGCVPTARIGKLPTRQMQYIRKAYAALITHIDDQIGRLVTSLRESGELGRTVIIFTSDHGEMLGDHHMFGKVVPYEGSTRVPFLISDWSGKLGIREPVCDSIIELRDILPTFLDAARLPIPSHVEGESLLPLVRGERAIVRPYLHGEHEDGIQSHHYIVDERYKYIWFSWSGEEQLFDLQQDPGERVDVKVRFPDVIALKREQLVEALDCREEGYVQTGKLVTGIKAKITLDHLQK